MVKLMLLYLLLGFLAAGLVFDRATRKYLNPYKLDLLTKWRANPFCGKIVIGGMQHDGTPKQTNGNDFRGY